MSNRALSKEYTCYNDCYKCLGGEKHLATLHIQTTSDAISWQDDDGVETAYFDPKRLELFLDMLNSLGYLPSKYVVKGEK